MKRLLFVCVTLAFSAGVLSAASPEVDSAIKAIQSVGGDAAKMKLFCDLVDVSDDDEEASAGEGKAAPAGAAKEEAAGDKEVDGLLAQLGGDFQKAWDVGAGLDEKSPDAKEFEAAVDALSAKCAE